MRSVAPKISDIRRALLSRTTRHRGRSIFRTMTRLALAKRAIRVAAEGWARCAASAALVREARQIPWSCLVGICQGIAA
jgi:hypothetical protein